VNYWNSEVVAIDTETTGLNWQSDKVFGVAIAWLDESGGVASTYFDVREQPVEYQKLRDHAAKIKKLVNHNLKFDLHMLFNDGVAFDLKKCHCTMIRSALIDEHRLSYSLDNVAWDCLRLRKQDDIYRDLALTFGGLATRAAQIKNLHRAPSGLVSKYARVDAELALKLYLWQEQEIALQGLGPVVNLERRLFPHIFRMERRGIRVDLDQAELRIEMLNGEISRLQSALNAEAGMPINCNPSKSIHDLFKPAWDGAQWVAIDGTILGTTDAGKPSLGSDELGRMKHPCAAMILKTRKLIKMRDTFLSGHVIGHSHNGRVHPNINQTKGDETGGTGTGRLSYTDPALQQIPSRDKEMARIIRPVFLPDEDQGWSYGDLDQHELRIFHHYVNNPSIVEAYAANPDLDGHAAVAKLTGLPRNPQPGGKSTANAKQMNLAMVFNMGGGELAATMGLPFTLDTVHANGKVKQFKKAGEEAQKIIDDYYRMMPGVKEISKKARSIASSRGYVKTLFGRHVRFPDRNFSYKASGLVYQGTAADLNKDNIIRICDYLDSECPEGNLLLNIHDEYSLSLPFGDAQRHLQNIKGEIQRRPELRIPIRIDFSELCSNWWDATVADKLTQ
jgi:DNA polymerase I-like protein with 3'-5' exonuclease and polymerase domains